MKTIGLIGGVSWVSTIEYYRILNQKINQQLGGESSAQMIINSVNFEEVYPMLKAGEWEAITAYMTKKAAAMKDAGAEILAIGSNTISRIGRPVAQSTGLQLVDIYECTAQAIKNKGLKKVALLGTAFTMTNPFYHEAYKQLGVETVAPNETEKTLIHEVIMVELTKAIFTEASKTAYLNIIEKMRERDQIEGVILGCTEIPLLIKQSDSELPFFDTTEIHANALIEAALA